MHKTNCMQSIENISMLEAFSSNMSVTLHAGLQLQLSNYICHRTSNYMYVQDQDITLPLLIQAFSLYFSAFQRGLCIGADSC